MTDIKKGSIEFVNVSFKYPSKTQKILRKASFKIEAGQKVGLVGHSGCGKSTVINILLRFYNIEDGEVLIDGVNINEYDVSSLRQ